jgi:hypothetical protein
MLRLTIQQSSCVLAGSLELPIHAEVNQTCGSGHRQQDEGEEDGHDADDGQRVLQVMAVAPKSTPACNVAGCLN